MENKLYSPLQKLGGEGASNGMLWERQRDKILIAGVKLFTARGVENTTMAAIQATAGISVNTFYKYFRDKKDLANEIYRGLRELVDSKLEAAAVENATARAEFHIKSIRTSSRFSPDETTMPTWKSQSRHRPYPAADG